MTSVASRDLRNHTSEVLGKVAEGASVTITVNGKPVAQLIPVSPQKPRFFTKAQLIEMLSKHRADAGLRGDLERLAGETLGDLEVR